MPFSAFVEIYCQEQKPRLKESTWQTKEKQKAEDIFDMISGTNGLMGAADGAFVLSKEKGTSNNATLDVEGRDQQDMKIHLVRDAEKLIWNFEKSETELWKEPPALSA